MGKTAFSGPLYGGKATLISYGINAVSTGSGNGLSSVVLYTCIVPSGEDWYATEFNVARDSTGGSTVGTGMVVNVQDDGTAVASIGNTSTTTYNTLSIITPTAGEYEGKQIASGSTVTLAITVSSGGTPSSAVSVTLSGYRRFINSTRAE
jgi:hypothetical protein